MGYIGQHLVSVVTGYRGKKSGARGDDLLVAARRPAMNGEAARAAIVGEIKTCYRVDQLGRCNTCGAGVASTELQCNALLDSGAECGSTDIKRNDDSKWLIALRDENELRQAFIPHVYYLVLFDFADMSNPAEINVRIYEVDPLCKGFAYCLVDYYFNIKLKSKSGAPFNLWPFSPKFYAMRPKLIYASLIGEDDSITTQVFPGKIGTIGLVPCPPLTDFSSSQNVGMDAVRYIAEAMNVSLAAMPAARVPRANPKAAMLAELQKAREKQEWDDAVLADALADGIYRSSLSALVSHLPEALRQSFPSGSSVRPAP